MNPCVGFIGHYMASCMGVPKFHALTQTTEVLWHTGEIEYSCGGLYGMSHKAFEDAYRNTSKRKATATEESSWKVAEKQNQLFAGNINPFYIGQSPST